MTLENGQDAKPRGLLAMQSTIQKGVWFFLEVKNIVLKQTSDSKVKSCSEQTKIINHNTFVSMRQSEDSRLQLNFFHNTNALENLVEHMCYVEELKVQVRVIQV